MCMETFLRLPEEKRTRFLDAAWEEFTRVSFAESSINQIVRRAGIPRGSFYQYFRDKEDLFAYLMAQVRDYFVQQYTGILREVKGDIFRTQLLCFDRFTRRKHEPDAMLEKFWQVLRLNPGLHMQMFLGERARRDLPEMLLREADLSAFRSEETARSAFFLSLLALSAAVMDVLHDPGEAETFRCQLEQRLDIIRRGSL